MNVIASRPHRTFRKLVTVVGFVALAGAAACAAGGASEPAEPTAEEQAAAQHHYQSPISVMVDTAVEHGDLSDEQAAAIVAIGDEFEAAHGDKHPMHEQLRSAAANVVRAGTSDSDQFDQAVKQASEALEEGIDANAAAMKKVHGLLTADQRVAVADALQQRIEERWNKHHQEREGTRGVRAKEVMTHLALSTVQLDKLKAIRDHFQAKEEDKRVRPSRKEIAALVEAFKTDDFAAALDTFNADKLSLIRERLASAGEHTDTALSILTEQQRDLVAELIEKGPRKVLLGQDADEHAQR